MFACTIYSPGNDGVSGKFFRGQEVAALAGHGLFHEQAREMVKYAISVERIVKPGDYFVVFASTSDGSVWTGTVKVGYNPPVPMKPQLVVVD